MSHDRPGTSGRALDLSLAAQALRDVSDLGLIYFDANGVIRDANDAACTILQLSLEELLGRSESEVFVHVVHRDGTPYAPDELPRAVSAATGKPVESVLLGVDVARRSRRWLAKQTVPAPTGPTDRSVVALFTDATEQVRREQTLRMLSLTNAFMAHTLDESELLQHLCETLVHRGGYALAWVGRAERAGEVLQIVAASGAVGYVYAGMVSTDEAVPAGQGGTGRAWRSARTQVINDYHEDPRQSPWAARLSEFGFRSGLAIPFHSPSRAVLSVYDRHGWTFDEVTVSGLEEIVRAVEIGIEHAVSVRERERALQQAARVAESARVSDAARADLDRRFELAFENSMAPTIFADAADRVVAANSSFCRLLGRSRESVLGTTSHTFAHPDDADLIESAHRRLIDEELDHVTYVCRYVHSDGRVVVTEVLKSRALDEDDRVQYFVLSHHDVTEQLALSTQLSHQSLHDPLTGLPNRLLFEDRLAQAHARSVRLGRMDAVILFDLDDFKGVNDVHGHQIGDQLLVAVGQRLLSQTRATDTLCRVAGDEFLYLAEGISSAHEAQAIVDRLMSALEEPFEAAGSHMRQRASAGVAIWDSSDIAGSDLIQRADLALYAAKAQGRARSAIFSPEMHREAIDRFTLAQEMRQALDSGEIRMHYQPIVDLQSLTVVGFESLMRWQHPTRGAISPAVFIPLAESADFILELGHFAMSESLKTLASWDAERPSGPRPYMAINCSARQFHHEDMLSNLRRILGRTGLSAERVVLEITESTTLFSAGTSLSVIEQVHAAGFQLALDDFGTGFSSLSYLARLRPDTLKIDKSFVNPAANDANATTVLEVISALGHKIGVTVLAEGVETRENLENLRSLGCQLGQGFLFSPAVPAERAAVMIDQPFVL